MPSDFANDDLATARRILQGDQAAFRDLFDRFFPRLYRFALAHAGGDHDVASDVVQQTMCKGIERLDTYRGEAALYTWFCQICRHALLDHSRRTQRARRIIQPIEDEPNVRAVLEAIAAPFDEQPEVQAWRSDVCRLVQATMDALPERYGDVLEWKYVDGLQVADIAARLTTSVKAAESLLTRARNAFREAILEMSNVQDVVRTRHPDWSL